MGKLTESGVEHVESHLVAFLCSGDCDQPLVAVILRFVDLDDTSAQVSNFVDFCAALSNDRSNHIVRNEDLLR